MEKFSLGRDSFRPSSSSSMKKFGADIQKQISLKQAKTYLPKSNKNTIKNAGFN